MSNYPVKTFETTVQKKVTPEGNLFPVYETVKELKTIRHIDDIKDVDSFLRKLPELGFPEIYISNSDYYPQNAQYIHEIVNNSASTLDGFSDNDVLLMFDASTADAKKTIKMFLTTKKRIIFSKTEIDKGLSVSDIKFNYFKIPDFSVNGHFVNSLLGLYRPTPSETRSSYTNGFHHFYREFDIVGYFFWHIALCIRGRQDIRESHFERCIYHSVSPLTANRKKHIPELFKQIRWTEQPEGLIDSLLKVLYEYCPELGNELPKYIRNYEAEQKREEEAHARWVERVRQMHEAPAKPWIPYSFTISD